MCQPGKTCGGDDLLTIEHQPISRLDMMRISHALQAGLISLDIVRLESCTVVVVNGLDSFVGSLPNPIGSRIARFSSGQERGM